MLYFVRIMISVTQNLCQVQWLGFNRFSSDGRKVKKLELINDVKLLMRARAIYQLICKIVQCMCIKYESSEIGIIAKLLNTIPMIGQDRRSDDGFSIRRSTDFAWINDKIRCLEIFLLALPCFWKQLFVNVMLHLSWDLATSTYWFAQLARVIQA